MEKLIAAITILATLATRSGNSAVTKISVAAALAGCVALLSMGIYDVWPKPGKPYAFLSISCGQGRPATTVGDTNNYVLLGTSITAGVGAAWLRPRSQSDGIKFATCLVRNEGRDPVYNVEIAFAYLGVPAGRVRQPIAMAHGKIEPVSVPHVGSQGAVLIFESEAPGMAFIAPTYECTLDNPELGHRQACTLRPLPEQGTAFVTQVPVAVFSELPGH